MPYGTAAHNGTNESRVVVEAHPFAVAQCLDCVWALIFFLLPTDKSAYVLTTPGGVVVAVGPAQPAAWSIGGAVVVVAPFLERFGAQIFPSGVVVDDGNGSVGNQPLIDVALVVSGVETVDLSGSPGNRNRIPVG